LKNDKHKHISNKAKRKAEKALDEKIKNLLNEKSNVEKHQKVSKTPKTCGYC
jgi:hypothetical protein